jgi:hypothetical protein
MRSPRRPSVTQLETLSSGRFYRPPGGRANGRSCCGCAGPKHLRRRPRATRRTATSPAQPALPDRGLVSSPTNSTTVASSIPVGRLGQARTAETSLYAQYVLAPSRQIGPPPTSLGTHGAVAGVPVSTVGRNGAARLATSRRRRDPAGGREHPIACRRQGPGRALAERTTAARAIHAGDGGPMARHRGGTPLLHQAPSPSQSLLLSCVPGQGSLDRTDQPDALPIRQDRTCVKRKFVLCSCFAPVAWVERNGTRGMPLYAAPLALGCAFGSTQATRKPCR